MRYTDLIDIINDEEPIAEYPINHTNNCFACSKKLRSFTVNRDWKDRRYHKSCFKRKEIEHKFEIMMDSFKNGASKSSGEILFEKFGL